MLFEHSMVKPTKVGNGEQIFRYVPYLVSNNLDNICNLINGLQQANPFILVSVYSSYYHSFIFLNKFSNVLSRWLNPKNLRKRIFMEYSLGCWFWRICYGRCIFCVNIVYTNVKIHFYPLLVCIAYHLRN